MAPREQNIEADALSNGNFAGFTASRRIAFKELADLPFVVVPSLMLAAAELDTEIKFESSVLNSRHARKSKLRQVRNPQLG